MGCESVLSQLFSPTCANNNPRVSCWWWDARHTNETNNVKRNLVLFTYQRPSPAQALLLELILILSWVMVKPPSLQSNRSWGPLLIKVTVRNSGSTLWQKNTQLNLIWASISTNQLQSESISINQNQSASSKISQHQSASICVLISICNWPGNYIYRHKCSMFLRSVRRLCEKVVRGRLQELLSELITFKYESSNGWLIGHSWY